MLRYEIMVVDTHARSIGYKGVGSGWRWERETEREKKKEKKGGNNETRSAGDESSTNRKISETKSTVSLDIHFVRFPETCVSNGTRNATKVRRRFLESNPRGFIIFRAT